MRHRGLGELRNWETNEPYSLPCYWKLMVLFNTDKHLLGLYSWKYGNHVQSNPCHCVNNGHCWSFIHQSPDDISSLVLTAVSLQTLNDTTNCSGRQSYHFTASSDLFEVWMCDKIFFTTWQVNYRRTLHIFPEWHGSWLFLHILL